MVIPNMRFVLQKNGSLMPKTAKYEPVSLLFATCFKKVYYLNNETIFSKADT